LTVFIPSKDRVRRRTPGETFAGEGHVIVDMFTYRASVDNDESPNRQTADAEGTKLDPVMVIIVPPDSDPLIGEMESTIDSTISSVARVRLSKTTTSSAST
jgi:hypothetical protein